MKFITCFYWILGEDELADGLKAFIEAIVNENVSLVISRQLLTDVATELVKIEDSVSKAVSHFTLEVVQPRVISFEEQVGCIRQHLADIYEREHNWRQAAQVELVSKELNHLAAILHVYARGSTFMN